MKRLLLAVIMTLVMAQNALAADFLFGEETKGLKVKIADDTDMTIRIRMQPRLDFGDLVKSEDGTSYESESDMYIRRLRLELGGNLYKNLKYALVFEADKNSKSSSTAGSSPTNEVKIQMANIDYKFSDAFQARFGKAKLPYSRVSLTSSSEQLLIERPASTEAAKKLFDDYYQAHLLLHGRFAEGVLAYNLAAGDGWEPNSKLHTGVNVHRSGLLYIARVELSPPGWVEAKKSDAPLGKGRHLTAAINYAAQNGIEYAGGSPFEEDRTLTGFDVSGHWNGLTGQFEYNALEEESTDPARTEKKPRGWYAQAGYFINGYNIEPALRYEEFDQDSEKDDMKEKTTTIGANWYGKGHSFKVAFNWARTKYEESASGYLADDDKKDVFQVQAQLYF